jgi:two-component system NtrC family sensor kinase
VVQGASIGTWEWNIQTGESTFNQNCKEILGHDLASLSSGSFFIREDYVVSKDLVQAVSSLKRHLAGKTKDFRCDLQVYRKDYELMWINVVGKLITLDDEGNPLKVYGTLTNITERKREERIKELLLKLSRRLPSLSMINTLQAIIDAAETVTYSRYGYIVVLDEEGKPAFSSFSSRTYRKMKIGREDLSESLSDKAFWQKSVQEKKIYIFESPSDLDNGERIKQRMIMPVLSQDRVIAVIIVANKVAEYTTQDKVDLKSLSRSAIDFVIRKQDELELQRSEERYRKIFDHITDAIIIVNSRNGKIIDANDAAIKTYNYSKKKLLTMQWKDLQRKSSSNDRLITNKSDQDYHKKNNGDVFPVRCFPISITLQGRECNFIIVKDLTAEEEAKRKLKITEERLNDFVSNAPIGLFITTPKGEFILANQAMCEIFGYDSVEELKASSLPDNMDFGRGRTRADFLLELKEKGVIKDKRFEWKRKDGSIVIVKETARAHYSDDGEISYLEGTIEDITEKMILEKEIAQAEKLQAVGQLASGIAHEINTPMQYISDNINFLRNLFNSLIDSIKDSGQGYIENLFPEDELGKKNQKLFKTIVEEFPDAIQDTTEGIDTVSKIVSSMKMFSHPGGENMQNANIHKLIEATLRVSKNEWKYIADIEKNFDQNLSEVACYGREFNQVILNMIINAKHAIERNIEEGNIKRGLIEISTKATSENAIITIRDNGCGMSEEVKSRIFEPFFTTKGIGKGTGQGLAISYDIIVDKHNGKLTVDSEIGKGTSFNIIIPISAEKIEDEGVIG